MPDIEQYPLYQQLKKLNIQSVFDVVRQSRHRFIDQVVNEVVDDITLSPQQAKALYDAAQSRASQITHAYLQSLGQIEQSADLFNNPLGLAETPTYPNLFPEDLGKLCLPDSLEATHSPAAYLHNLYQTALNIEQSATPQANKLSHRRPDLANLMIDANSHKAEVRTQDLVNEILSQGIEQQQTSDQDGKKLSTAESLATTRFPFTLPYDAPGTTITQSLQACQTSWDEVLLDNAEQPIFLAQDIAQTTIMRRAQRTGFATNPELSALCCQAPVIYSGVLRQKGDEILGPDITSLVPWMTPDTLKPIVVAGQTSTKSRAYRYAFIAPRAPNVIAVPAANELVLDHEANKATIFTITCSSNIKGSKATRDVKVHGVNIQQSDKKAYSRYINDVKTDESVPLKRFLKLTLQEVPIVGDNESFTGTLRLQAKDNNSGRIFAEFVYAIIIEGKDADVHQRNTERYCLQHYGQRLSDTPYQSVVSLPLASVLTRCELTRGELEQLLCQQDHRPRISVNCPPQNALCNPGNTPDHFPAPYHYGAVYLHAARGPRITLDDSSPDAPMLTGSPELLERLHRFIRLQKALAFDDKKLDHEQLDLLLTACMRAEEGNDRASLTFSDNTLRALGVFRQWQQRYGINAEHFAALLNEISPYAIGSGVPLFDRIFNKNSAADNVMILDGLPFEHSPADPLPVWIMQLCSGLAINANEYRLLAPLVAQQWVTWEWVEVDDGSGKGKRDELTRFPDKLRRSLPVVSAFYRLTSLFRLLGYKPEEGVALVNLIFPEPANVWQQLAGKPTLSSRPEADRFLATKNQADMLDVMTVLEQAARWLQQNHIAPGTLLQLVTCGQETTDTPPVRSWLQALAAQVSSSLITRHWIDNHNIPAEDDDKVAINWLTVLNALVDPQGVFHSDLTTNTLSDLVIAATENLKLAALPEVQKTLAIALSVEMEKQRKTVSDQLSNKFGLMSQVPPLLLRLIGESEQTLLNGALTTTEETASQTVRRMVFKISMFATVIVQLNLGPALLTSLIENPQWWHSTANRPTDAVLTLELFYHLCSFAQLRDSVEEGEALILSWLKNANSPVNSHSLYSVNADADSEDPQRSEKNKQHLQALFGFNDSDCKLALAQKPVSMHGLARLIRQQTLLTQTGLSLDNIHHISRMAPDSGFDSRQTLAYTLLNCVRAKFQESQQ